MKSIAEHIFSLGTENSPSEGSSLMENSALAVLECLLAGVPFLATDIGGFGIT
jgi:hypothetical protein